MNGTTFEDFFGARVDFVWGKGTTSKDFFWNLFVIVGRKISLSYIYCNKTLPVALQSSVCAFTSTITIPITSTMTFSITFAAIFPSFWCPQFLFWRRGSN